MSDLTEPPRGRSGNAFTGRLGPLPVWAWGAIVGALILAWFYLRKRTPTSGATSGATTGASVTAAYPSQVSNVPLQNTANVTGNTSGTADTNTSWLQQGIKQATDLGYTPLDAETALRNYLDGTPLTSSQANIVNAVETAQGSAPQGLGGTPSVTSGAPQGQLLGYYRQTGTPAVYAFFSDGTRKWVDSAQYAALGSPQYTDQAATNPIWQNYKVSGTDAPAGMNAK